MPVKTVISGIGEAHGATPPADSLEGLIYNAATAALADAGLERSDIDGVVLAASDQVDGRAISSMLTSAPAGAYLNEEINVASSPGHALALAYLQIASGTHRRLLVSSWGKASETANGSTQAAEQLSAEPFFERDARIVPVAQAAMQAHLHRRSRPLAEEAAHHVAASRRGDGTTAADVAASPLIAHPLRRAEWPAEIDGAFSLVLERAERDSPSVVLQGVGWCADSGRLAERDLVGLPHLRRAVADAARRAGIEASPEAFGTWHLHDYTPDAELLACEAVALCADGEAPELALAGVTARTGARPVSPAGGSLAGEAPFGGPLRKLLDAVRQLRGQAGIHQVQDVSRSLVQISTGPAGQFQTVLVLGQETA
jgi:acetyl-CoA acetyltransferase